MNQRCAIVGATGGVGGEVSRRLVGNGHQVFLIGRDMGRLDALSSDLNALANGTDIGSDVLSDLRPVTLGKSLLRASDSMGGLDGVVHCVGSVLLKSAHATTDEEWSRTIETNLTSAFGVVRAAGKLMRKSGGSVVLISTAAARIGLANHEAIAAAKAGVTGLMRSAAATYASRGIRFNAIAPGLVQTGMTRDIWSIEASAERSRKMHALGRLGEPADIASLAVWLLDPENSWITGQEIAVDGGLSSLRVTAH